jgi:hypothetical protein
MVVRHRWIPNYEIDRPKFDFVLRCAQQIKAHVTDRTEPVKRRSDVSDGSGIADEDCRASLGEIPNRPLTTTSAANSEDHDRRSLQPVHSTTMSEPPRQVQVLIGCRP